MDVDEQWTLSLWLHHNDDVGDGGCKHGCEGGFVHLKVAHTIHEAAALKFLDHALKSWPWDLLLVC